MAKRQFKEFYYRIDDDQVLIWFRDSDQPSHYRFAHFYPAEYVRYKGVENLAPPSEEQVEDYLSYLRDILEKQKRMIADWDQKIKSTDPIYKKGDYLIYELSYATVLYRVVDIGRLKDGGPFYKLQGVRILKDNGENPYKSEARHYQPFCYILDVDHAHKVKFVSGDTLETLLKSGVKIAE